jgi:hypothetical protein
MASMMASFNETGGFFSLVRVRPSVCHLVVTTVWLCLCCLVVEWFSCSWLTRKVEG